MAVEEPHHLVLFAGVPGYLAPLVRDEGMEGDAFDDLFHGKVSLRL